MSARSGGWRSRAACRGTDPEAFFPTAEDGPVYDAQVAAAKAICRGCPVRAECLEEALARMPFGVAGGLTPEERRGARPPRVSGPAVLLEAGLARRASRRELQAAGRVLLAAGRPVAEVAARCRVSERTVQRWRSHTGAEQPSTPSPSKRTGCTSAAAVAAGGQVGTGAVGAAARPRISHTRPGRDTSSGRTPILMTTQTPDTPTRDGEGRPPALVQAEVGTDGWTDAVRHQRWAVPDHADFYALAAEFTSTLHAFEDLTALLAAQVAAYGEGRRLYDDTHEVDPAVRVADAVAQLDQARAGLRAAAVAANEFWSAIGHVGVEDPDPTHATDPKPTGLIGAGSPSGRIGGASC